MTIAKQIAVVKHTNITKLRQFLKRAINGKESCKTDSWQALDL